MSGRNGLLLVETQQWRVCMSDCILHIAGIAGCIATVLHDAVMTPSDGKYCILKQTWCCIYSE